MSSIHLNATRIEQLVEQLNGLNKRLMGLEGKLLRYALSCKIKREDFLEVYQKSELDPNWIENVSHKSDKHWKTLSKIRYRDCRTARQCCQNGSGMRPADYRVS